MKRSGCPDRHNRIRICKKETMQIKKECKKGESRNEKIG